LAKRKRRERKMIRKTIGNATLYCGDSNEVLEQLTDIDSCVTDPPYGLSFMGKSWDYDVPQKELWEKVFASLKNGSHLLAFFGSRTYHRGAIPIEDAGFEIRDQLMWIYGSGFPKSHNIGKAVDKLQGNEREVVERPKKDHRPNADKVRAEDNKVGKFGMSDNKYTTKGNSEWEGWGTALKPAHEPIVMARKPIKGTVAENVLEHGTGGINIDECRVGNQTMINRPAGNKGGGNSYNLSVKGMPQDASSTTSDGRFPANVMHDGSDVVQEIFANKDHYFYCAKASKKDRDEGLEQLETPTENLQGLDTRGSTLIREDGTKTLVERWKPNADRKNNHPTVKPTELMRYLCRLVTPKGGIVLDPFMGSGSTGKAAILEGFHFVGIELDPEYFEIACARIEKAVRDKNKEMF